MEPVQTPSWFQTHRPDLTYVQSHLPPPPPTVPGTPRSHRRVAHRLQRGAAAAATGILIQRHPSDHRGDGDPGQPGHHHGVSCGAAVPGGFGA